MVVFLRSSATKPAPKHPLAGAHRPELAHSGSSDLRRCVREALDWPRKRPRPFAASGRFGRVIPPCADRPRRPAIGGWCQAGPNVHTQRTVSGPTCTGGSSTRWARRLAPLRSARSPGSDTDAEHVRSRGEPKAKHPARWVGSLRRVEGGVPPPPTRCLGLASRHRQPNAVVLYECLHEQGQRLQVPMLPR